MRRISLFEYAFLERARRTNTQLWNVQGDCAQQYEEYAHPRREIFRKSGTEQAKGCEDESEIGHKKPKTKDLREVATEM